MSKTVNLHIRLIAAALTLAIWSATATADIIYVDPNASGAGDGSSWDDAYNYLQDALTDADYGDQIRVAEGTYRPDQKAANPYGSDSASATFKLEDGVEIYGGYAGFGEPYPNERDTELYETILTGVLSTKNSLHVVTGSGTDATAVLDGFTITGGNAVNTSGGGMFNYPAGSPTVVKCLFKGNSAALRGGGMYNWSGSAPTLIDCSFENNSADLDGGGIYNTSASPEILNCSFTGNSANQFGGGVCIWNGTANLVNCLFSGNSATLDGAAMYSSGGTQTITVTNCTFSGNRAESDGGGMYSSGGTQTVTNSIFWGNEDSGGTGEPAQIQGGFSQVTYSCIQDEDPNDSYVPFECPDCNNIDDNPMFVRDPNNGGDGWGVGANDDYGDLHLLPGSPCIDAGDNISVPLDTHDLDNDADTTELTPLDLDYAPRFIDDPTTTNTGNPDPSHDPNIIVDMGAYEFAPEPQEGVAGDIDGDGDVDLVDFAILSYQWLDVPGQPSADIAPPGGDGEVNSDDLLVVAQNWLTGAEVPTEPTPECVNQCSGHMKGIRNALLIYANEYDDDFPLTLDELVTEGIILNSEIEIFVCPCTDDVVGDVSYIYRGAGLDGTMPIPMILAHDKSDNHSSEDGSYTVLFVDGHVERLTQEEFIAALEVDNQLRVQEGLPQISLYADLTLDDTWMYQNLGGSTNANLTANVSITDDPYGNSSYSYTWEFILPDDVSVEPSTVSGGGTGDVSWNFAAPNVNQPQGLSDSGQAITVIVTVTGNDFSNTGQAEAQFGIALLGDVNNDRVVNVADRSIINAFWRLGAAGSFTFTDCNINCDTAVNVADRSIANAVWRGVLGQNSVSEPCPFR